MFLNENLQMKSKRLNGFLRGFFDGIVCPYKFLLFSFEMPEIDYSKCNIESDWVEVGKTMIDAAKKMGNDSCERGLYHG